jgi:hypothetical protein
MVLFFYISVKLKKTKIGYRVELGFGIGLHSRDRNLIENLIKYFNCGNINTNINKSAVYLNVRKLSEIINFIIPNFRLYPLQGIKKFDFEDFCKIADLIKNKEHLTENGFNQIKKYYSNMNQRRNNLYS